ncbi:MAG: 4-hydroxy-tetrahydrodipicolinate reductase [Nitrospirae bacterium]|nr:4-hydroxy-tetrahydrodipicolinate reductase [Nitrospirota bacterium]MBF0521310.1 4-hydroxy-tetrahydrodipicolinate reductase [Nitrospirota bacterium]MBF0534607.1 4-hydroxy-tetrahydrodipicolinate reductase [Nitrospirota bacterium]MBF0616349.1 4-hydroxy-tetrahydrodipicolinate reductase [Nitrospirota bacterium]
MIKVVVAGASGKMGQRIGVLATEHPEITLSGASERSGHSAIGKDFADVAGGAKTGVFINNSSDALRGADVVIEFTVAEATLENLKTYASLKIPAVIGTTGLSAAQIEELKQFAKTIPIVFAPNMSVGVNLLLRVLKDVASTLGDDYDIEIVEAHHRLKKDAPSGTAIKMAQVIAESLGRDLNEVGVYERKGIIGERTKKEIGIQTVRAGDIVGEHTVMFGGMGERIEITHKASSRDTFARGALRAALWLKNKPAGLYDMQDVLGLK